jgi:CrcB protein
VKAIMVAAAGAAGAVARYGIAVAVGVRDFPWSTLGINVAGSFVLGLLVTVAGDRAWSTSVVLPLSVGFLGAFTTFSTFSYETYTLLRTGRGPEAAAYIGMSVGLGIAAAAAGYATGRAVA